MKKIISGMILTLLLVSIFTSVFTIQPVKADLRTWTVDDDGPADFSKIQDAVNAASPGDTIVVKAGTYNESVGINKDHLTVKSESGADETIVNAESPVDYLFKIASDYVEVSGFTIQGATKWYGYGIYLYEGVNHCWVSDNNLFDNWCGIRLFLSNDNILSNNTLRRNYACGILLDYYCNNNTLTNNIISNSDTGIGLIMSSANTLRGNIIFDNRINFMVSGGLSTLIHDIDTSNMVNGKPIYYLVNQHDRQIPEDAGFVGIIDSSNIVIKDLTLQNNYAGILLAYSTNCRIENTTISNNLWGILLICSSNNLITKVNVSNNLDGIIIQGSNNIVANNNISNNHYGYCGIRLERAGSNKIINNTISNNGMGIYFFDSASNEIYHNNFIDNRYYQAEFHDWWFNLINIFDSGYPSGGNYWSDYEQRYPYAKELDGSGIWDTPYIINDYNKDRYPLTKPWTPTPAPTLVQGVDVSHHQGNIDWPQVYGAGYRFAFVKASEGVGWEDPLFTANMDNGRDAGLLMGAYHFARPDLGNDAADEAMYFISVAGDYLTEGYLRPVLDLERGATLGKEALSNWVHTWMETVKSETGIEPIIYVNSDYANNHLDASVAKYDLWIAHWTYDPATSPNTGIWGNWGFWQYSDQGSVPGITGHVDLNLFNGDMSRLHDNFVIYPVSEPQPPVAAFTYSPESPSTNRAIMFDATSSIPSLPDGRIVSYEWDFGDGLTGSGVKTTHSYNKAKTYTVTLNVTDDRGATATKKIDIFVSLDTTIGPATEKRLEFANLGTPILPSKVIPRADLYNVIKHVLNVEQIKAEREGKPEDLLFAHMNILLKQLDVKQKDSDLREIDIVKDLALSEDEELSVDFAGAVVSTLYQFLTGVPAPFLGEGAKLLGFYVGERMVLGDISSATITYSEVGRMEIVFRPSQNKILVNVYLEEPVDTVKFNLWRSMLKVLSWFHNFMRQYQTLKRQSAPQKT